MKIKTFVTGFLQINTYLVYDEDTLEGFIVDIGKYLKDITDFVKKEGIYIKYIIVTHGHDDHTGGVNDQRKDFPDAKVVAHKGDIDWYNDPRLNGSIEISGKPNTIKIDEYVNDGDTLTVGNMKLDIIHTPGHTPGGICIYTPNALFSGDTLFSHSIGRTDFTGGSFEDITRSIREKLYKLPDDTEVYPGHMGTTTIGIEKKNNPFVPEL